MAGGHGRLAPFSSFPDAATAVLHVLQARCGFRFWMVTRYHGDELVVLASLDDGTYGIEAGAHLSYADSLCARMVEGLGPRVAPAVALVPAYAEAPAAKALPIGAYMGVPLHLGDGSLFGTLCALDPEPQPEACRELLDLLELQGRLLATTAVAQSAADDLARTAERAALAGRIDPMTGLPDHGAWVELLAHEEDRCARLGLHASVVVVDLDDLRGYKDERGRTTGDTLIAAVAWTLRGAVRGTDLVARVGGADFAVLALGADEHAALLVRDRLELALEDAGVAAHVGCATREAGGDLSGAWLLAHGDLSHEKSRRREA